MIPLFPTLDDLAICNVLQNEAVEQDALAGRRNGTEGRRVGAGCHPTQGNFVTIDQLICNREMQIRKGRQKRTEHLLKVSHTKIGLLAGSDMDHTIGGKHFVRGGNITAVQAFYPLLLISDQLKRCCFWRLG